MSEPYVKIWLPGEPRAMGRPRSAIRYTKERKPFIQIYPERDDEIYKRALGMAGRVAMGARPPLEEALSVAVDVFKTVPKSWSNRDRDKALTGLIMPTSKPDGDNYLKMIDGLSEIVWTDDAIVVRKLVTKYYSETPGMLVSVWKWFA